MKRFIGIMVMFAVLIGTAGMSWATALDIKNLQLRTNENASAAIGNIEGGKVISVTATNGDHWAANGYFEDISIEAGKKYLVRFKAQANVERPCVVQLNKNGAEDGIWTYYTEQRVYLTIEPTWNEVILTAPVSDTASLLIFNVGAEEGEYSFYEVEFSEYTPENGILHLGEAQLRSVEGITATARLINSELEVQVDGTNGNAWSVHVDQEGVSVQAQEEYKLTFRAKADADRPCTVQLLHNGMVDGNWPVYVEETVMLSDGWKEYTLVVTPNTTDGNAILAFNFGAEDGMYYLGYIRFNRLISDVTNVTATPIYGQGKVHLSWTGNQHASEYWIFLQENGMWDYVGKTTDDFCNVEDLETGKEYNILVVAAGDGLEAMGVEVSVTTLGWLKGDLNGDGVLNKKDADIALDILANRNPVFYKEADTDGDSQITLKDALYVLQEAR